jgi:serine protease Do
MGTADTADTAFARDLGAVTDALRRVTVQVHTGRGRGAGFAGSGSGVVWRPDGLIVTNAHVARGPRATVELSDGRTFDARVAARDDRRDLAALEVSATGLPTPTIGDPRVLRPGDLVIAVGNPLGVVGAAAVGIVHHVDAGDGDRGPRWIRADVRLAPGNSGGPLADARGRVLGVNAMIYNGLGMAVPSTAIARFLRRVDAGAPAVSLGVVARPVMVALGLRPALGLMLVEVADGGAAARAGLTIGDVLLAADGEPFAHPGDLRAAMDDAGARLRVDLVRGGRRLTCEVPLRQGEEARAA